MKACITRRSALGALLAASALSVPGLRAAAPRRRPNIVTIVLDDVGYSDIGCFGAEIRTPAIDALAAAGLRYSHFDTKAVCSSTRAALMTGRNSHTVNMPDVPDLSAAAGGNPKLRDLFVVPQNAEMLPQALKRAGYATWAVGKWHLIPAQELGETAPRTSWPRQRGFDYFYGFARGWTDQYKPALVENDAYIHPELPADYHLSVDLADKAIGLIERHSHQGGNQPFYLNLAFGAAHAPIQVPREWSSKYDAIYARGWDAIREERFARQLKLGLVPPGTVLPPRTASDRAWASLDADEKAVFARYMAVYAGFLEHCDHQIGRVLATLERLGLEQDTLVMLFSDNGAASEAGQKGEFDGLYRPNTLTPAQQHARIDELGTAKTEAEYPRPWALAGDTPFRRYKLWPFSGGTRTAFVARWPGHVTGAGSIRRQYVDVVDVAPTLLAAAGASFAESLGGTKQMPVAGRSFLDTLTSAIAPGRQVQYFELRGNRAITSGRWRAVAMHDCGKPYENDNWELFDLSSDFAEANDLAAQMPRQLATMKALWDDQWQRYGTGPRDQPIGFVCMSGGSFER